MNVFLDVIVVLHVIVCFFLIAVVLLQQGRSADLAGAFGGQGSQTAFGPRAAANVLTRLTTWSAVIFHADFDHADRALRALGWRAITRCWATRSPRPFPRPPSPAGSSQLLSS
jgi:protein translocase SecG subunit